MTGVKVSLCIPTNGIIEWIFPVLDSIYQQGVSWELFEVVVVDNGNSKQFEKLMKEYKETHSNLVYERVECPIFMSEIETYRRARGALIKFINHRTLLLPGTLQFWIDFVEENIEEKPIIYFANGVLDKKLDVFKYSTFDDFVRELGYWSTWSTGMTIWKSDFDRIPQDHEFNQLFPHTSVLFGETERKKYILDNRIYLQEITADAKKKGKYDLFYAFAVEYPYILLELYRQNKISLNTFLVVKKDNLSFVCELYEEYIIKNKECSYDVINFEEVIEIFYSADSVKYMLAKREEEYENALKRSLDSAKIDPKSKILFGAGRMVREAIARYGLSNLLYVVDNDEAKCGRMYLGLPVVKLDYVKKMQLENEIIICIQSEAKYEVGMQLEKSGIKNYTYFMKEALE